MISASTGPADGADPRDGPLTLRGGRPSAPAEVGLTTSIVRAAQFHDVSRGAGQLEAPRLMNRHPVTQPILLPRPPPEHLPRGEGSNETSNERSNEAPNEPEHSPDRSP
jgi:hypothetical protein